MTPDPSDRLALSAVVARLDPAWCPESEDGRHCDHWHDCEACHACGAPYLPDPQCDCTKCATARGVVVVADLEFIDGLPTSVP